MELELRRFLSVCGRGGLDCAMLWKFWGVSTRARWTLGRRVGYPYFILFRLDTCTAVAYIYSASHSPEYVFAVYA